jgi:hypothetical protein
MSRGLVSLALLAAGAGGSCVPAELVYSSPSSDAGHDTRGIDAGSGDAPREGGDGGDAHRARADAHDADLCGDATRPTLPVLAKSAFAAALPPTPNIAANSPEIVAYYSQNYALAGPSNGSVTAGLWFVADPPNPENDPNISAVYFARSTDPEYTIRCDGGLPCGLNGVTLNIPTGIQWQFSPSKTGDDHLIIVNPDASTIFAFYKAQACEADGPSCPIGAGGSSSVATGTGFATNGSATNSAWTGVDGLITPDELAAGAIEHALAIGFPCGKGFVPPAESEGNGCPGSPALAFGQRVYFAAGAAEINAWKVPEYTKIVARAMATYGAYFVNTLSVPMAGGASFFGVNAYSYAAGCRGLADGWPAASERFDGGIPRGGVDNSYDLGFDLIPGPDGGANGWAGWLRVCSPEGC